MNFKERINRYYYLVDHQETETLEEAVERLGLYEEIQLELTKTKPINWKVHRKHERYGYVLWKEGSLVYIGIAVNPVSRCKQHQADKDFDSMTVWVGGSWEFVEQWEKENIEKFQPPLNKQLYKNGRMYLHESASNELYERCLQEYYGLEDAAPVQEEQEPPEEEYYEVDEAAVYEDEPLWGEEPKEQFQRVNRREEEW
jgi:hypothetical protein